MGNQTENQILVIIVTLSSLYVHCQKDDLLNSFSVIHVKPVSHKLHEIEYVGKSFNCSLRKKIKSEFPVNMHMYTS